MFKNFLKIILIAMLFVGGGFVGDEVKAVDCCVTVSIPGNTPVSCRLKNNIVCDTAQKSAQDCKTRVVGGDPELVCSGPITYTKEEQVSCALFQVCREKASKELTDCTAQKTAGDCGLISSALCFWSANRNKCFSVNDSTNCPDANATDCAYLKPAGCQWDEKKALCQTTLSAGVSDKYTTKGEFLPSCAAAGQCRRLSDIFHPVLKFVDWIFRYIGAIAFIFFVYGGFTMILSFGNSEKFKHGQQILVAAVIGLIIVFSAYLMVSFLLEALGVSGEFKVIN